MNADGVPPLRYTRIDRDDSTGIEVWLAEGTVLGVGLRRLDFVGVRAGEGLAFDPTSAASQWRAEGLYLNDPARNSAPSITLFDDGTARGLSVARRRVDRDGGIEMTRLFLGRECLRRRRPLQRVDPHWLVLEVVDFSWTPRGTNQSRVSSQRDRGTSQ